MRLFTALDLPAGVVENLEQLIGRLRPTAAVQWSPPANLHVTTKFIGEWPDGLLSELETALSALPTRPEIPVRIRKLGFFPNARVPRVFWCGVEAEGLAELAAATDEATAALGVAREGRTYTPHLTLARIRDRADLSRLQATIGELASDGFGSFTADRFFLYHSQLRPRGSVYTKLAEFLLTR